MSAARKGLRYGLAPRRNMPADSAMVAAYSGLALMIVWT